jgi:aconitate hydratase
VSDAVSGSIDPEMFSKSYENVFLENEMWNAIPVGGGELYEWDPDSTYIRRPPYFRGMSGEPEALKEIRGARVLGLFGDSITTDHISPAGNIAKDSPAGRYLMEQGVKPRDFNQYGTRRGNHEVMMRGTFANIRIKNLLLGGEEGGNTLHLPDGTVKEFQAIARLDTPVEVDYYRNGGILQTVLRNLLKAGPAAG